MDRRNPHPDIAKRGLVTITLECGDQVTARNPPLNNKTRYSCPAVRNGGSDCGYNVRWVKYQHYGSSTGHDNALIAAEQKAG